MCANLPLPVEVQESTNGGLNNNLKVLTMNDMKREYLVTASFEENAGDGVACPVSVIILASDSDNIEDLAEAFFREKYVYFGYSKPGEDNSEDSECDPFYNFTVDLLDNVDRIEK